MNDLALGGGVAVLAICIIAFFVIFGTGGKLLKKVLRVVAIILAVYALWLWRGSWLPYVEPVTAVLADAARTGLVAFKQIMEGPRG